MAHYEIRIHGPGGDRTLVWDLDRPDDVAALNTAVEICRQRQIEVWDEHRQIGSIAIEGTPHLVA